jgi:hypothetical protein
MKKKFVDMIYYGSATYDFLIILHKFMWFETKFIINYEKNYNKLW